MRVLLLICAVIICQSCGSLVQKGANVCDNLKAASPIRLEKKAPCDDSEQTAGSVTKKGEKSLLLYRMLNTL